MSISRLPLAAVVSAFGAALLMVAVPGAAEAHILQGEAGGFLHGFEHLLSGLDHLLESVIGLEAGHLVSRKPRAAARIALTSNLPVNR